MAPHISDRFKFRRVNEITGIFVLAVLASLIAAVVWTARSQRWFKSTVTLQITLPEAGAAGIRPGSEVYFLGTLVGTVSDVLVEPTGRMEAHARIRRDFFLFVRADSSAVVKKKFGVAGDAFFEITRGVGKTLREQNARIICNEQFQSSLESAIEEIRTQAVLVLNKASSGIDTWSRLGSDLSESRRKLDLLTARCDIILAGIESGHGTVGQLIVQPDMANDLRDLVQSGAAALNEARTILTNLSVAVKNVEAGSAALPEIGLAMSNEAKDLPGLVRQSQTSMREMERLMEAMQQHWLIRRYVNITNPPRSSLPEPKPQTTRSQR